MILAIDTSTAMISVALYDGSTILGEFTWKSPNRHSTVLAPAVGSLFRKTGVQFSDLSALTVALGPGSFTSLRIGLAFAKGINAALNIPIVGVPTLSYFAASQQTSRATICAVLTAGREKYATQFFENKANGCAAISEIDVHTIESLSAIIVAPTVITGEVTGEMRTALRRSQNRNIRFSSPGFELRRAGFLAVQAWKLFRKGAYESGDGLTPIYLHTNGPAIRAGA